MSNKENLDDMRAQVLAIDDWIQELSKRHSDPVVAFHLKAAQTALAHAHNRLQTLSEASTQEVN